MTLTKGDAGNLYPVSLFHLLSPRSPLLSPPLHSSMRCSIDCPRMKNILPFVCCLLMIGCTPSRERFLAYKRSAITRSNWFVCEKETGRFVDPYEQADLEALRTLSPGYGKAAFDDIRLSDDDYVVRLYERAYLPGILEMDDNPIRTFIEFSSVGGKKVIEYATGSQSLQLLTDAEVAARIEEYVEKRDLFDMKSLQECDSLGDSYGQVIWGLPVGVSYSMQIKKGNRYHAVQFELGSYGYAPYHEMIELFNDFY